jgi:hypothetical protein
MAFARLAFDFVRAAAKSYQLGRSSRSLHEEMRRLTLRGVFIFCYSMVKDKSTNRGSCHSVALSPPRSLLLCLPLVIKLNKHARTAVGQD